MHIRVFKFLFAFLFLLTFLVACFQGEQSNINSLDGVNDDSNGNQENVNDDQDHTNMNNSNNGEINEDRDELNEETAKRELYLLDVNDMIVAQTFDLPLPESKEVATQVLQYLVKDGPVTELLPNGFQAVLPEGTEILGVSLQEDGSIIVDFSEEFTNYQAEEESKILQSVTYTLTQFDSIDRVYLRINGHPISEMPINGTPVEEGYSRAKGINYYITDTIDLITSVPVTLYYPAEYNENRYFVPITQHINKEEEDPFTDLVSALIDGPSYEANVIHVFNTETALIEPPKLEGGILQLEFNNHILKDPDEQIIADDVMETLTRTLTNHPTVNAIKVKVDDVNVIMNEKGEEYLEPVTIDYFTEDKKI